jgi:hypothetical protein
MVFRKRGGLLPSEEYFYKGHKVHVVNYFNYLGTVFNYTGSFALNQEQLVGKALKVQKKAITSIWTMIVILLKF